MTKKRKKKRHLFGKKEFLFNFFSILIVMMIAIYFGGRSFYYYSKQSMNKKIESQTLNGLIIQNNPVTTEDGLHQDKEGYFFKGAVQNNYVMFANRLFRIVRVNADKSVKVVSVDLPTSFVWGEKSSYRKSNFRVWLEKTDSDYSGVYYNTIPAVDKFLKKTSYAEYILKNDKIVNSKEKYSDYITILSIYDYIMAGGKNSYLNDGKIFYLLGLSSDNENLYVEEDGSVQNCDNLSGYGVKPVLTFKSNLAVSSGDGTITNPYVIDQGKNKNYVGSYVKLGNDMWRVISDQNGILKLQLNNYLVYNNDIFAYHYSDFNSLFDLNDKKSLAYFLNSSYLTTLPYSDILLDTDFFVGEISDDEGYFYSNIYKNKVTSKVGLMNIFDYHVNVNTEDYFHMNTTSQVGSMEYVYYKNGLLKEVDVREIKNVVPVIAVNHDVIKGGNGIESDPYVVG